MPGCIDAFVSNYAVTHHLAIIRCPLALNRPIQEKILGTNILEHDTVPGIIDNFVFVFVTFCAARAQYGRHQEVRKSVGWWLGASMFFLMCFFSTNLLLRTLSQLVQAPNSKSDSNCWQGGC